MTRKVLITGGAGFIGFHLAKKLLNLNYEIDILDNFSRGVNDLDLARLAKNKKIKLLSLDMLDKNQCKKITEENYSYIYHLAAIIGVKHVLKSPYHVLQKKMLIS